MAYFNSLQHFIDTITARFNKPKRSLVNEGINKQDIIDVLTDTAKRQEDVLLATQAINANFIARSLTLLASVYIDGTNGSDTRTGASAAQALKTMAKAIELYSNKAMNLVVYIIGTVEVNANMALCANHIWFCFYGDGKILIKKLPTDNGSYCLWLGVSTAQFMTFGGGLGVIETEAHSGNVGGALSADAYARNNGGIRLLKLPWRDWRSAFKHQTIGVNVIKLTAGANTTIFCGQEDGCINQSFLKTSFIYYDQMYNDALGSGAAYDFGFYGNRNFPRSYTPTSSTDTNVLDGEQCQDANYIYQKRGSTIKRVALSSF